MYIKLLYTCKSKIAITACNKKNFSHFLIWYGSLDKFRSYWTHQFSSRVLFEVPSSFFRRVPKTIPRNITKPSWVLERNFLAQSSGLSKSTVYNWNITFPNKVNHNQFFVLHPITFSNHKQKVVKNKKIKTTVWWNVSIYFKCASSYQANKRCKESMLILTKTSKGNVI